MFNFYKYRVEVYEDEKCLGVFQYVVNVGFISLWLLVNPMYRKWNSIKVFDRQTDNFIGQYARGGDIPSKP